jgi:UDP-2,3-diacylglucosamine pyrophosphatase LpxH
MKSHRNSEIRRLVLVISDLHLGAGKYVKGRRNLLEDFHYDAELIDFLDWHSQGDFEPKAVDLVINGDFLDFLAVPYVPFFDDEFWSEQACLEKLRIIMRAHRGVMQALKNFVSKPHKTITYVIGNHDAEFVLDSLKEEFKAFFGKELEDRVIIKNEITTLNPVPGVYIQHGHQYERAHEFDPHNSVVTTPEGRRYFTPSWGSYYVINVINRYKQERPYINAVRPIKHFVIHGLLFDTFFILRFALSNFHYYFMVRFWSYIMLKVGVRQLIQDLVHELTLFQDYETLTRDFFVKEPLARALIVGHTHNPTFRISNDGTFFINTGTWTNMVNLDLEQWNHAQSLPYARIATYADEVDLAKFDEQVEVDLKVWRGTDDAPYKDFT